MIKLVPRIRKIFIKKVKLLKDSVCNVAVVNPPRGSFDYITTETFYVGQIVKVPLRSKICLGIVLGKGKSRIDKSKLRNIIKKIDLPEFTVEFLNFCKWTSDWTMQELSNRLDEAEKKIIDIAETTRLMVVHVAKIKSRMGL